MRSLERNKQTIYYALYASKVEQTDAYGNKTGTYQIQYSEATRIDINVSAAKGILEAEQFGITADYSRTMTTNDLECPITEGTVLWVGISPTAENGSAIPHNYVVTKVAKSINSITYAIKEVSVS